jgi:integrase
VHHRRKLPGAQAAVEERMTTSRAPTRQESTSHRDRQPFERQTAGVHWHEFGLVFTTIGTPLDPRNVLRIWHGLLAKAGLERCTFHVSRHTAVSLLIAEGVPLKVIQ